MAVLEQTKVFNTTPTPGLITNGALVGVGVVVTKTVTVGVGVVVTKTVTVGVAVGVAV